MSNYRKLFIYKFATSRYYRPILSVYFLSLPGNSIEEVGIYVSVLLITWFFIEIPSWYIGDTIWHKNTLALAQVCFILWILFFISWSDITYFIAGTFLLALWRWFDSWTCEAYFYEMMADSGKWEEFWSQRWRFRWNIALTSIPVRVWLPIIWEFSLLLAFYISIWFCIAWFLWAFFLDDNATHTEIKETKNIQTVVKDQRWTWTYLIICIFAFIWWLYISELNYREPFVIDLWLSIWYVWIMIWLSRLIMWGIGNSSYIKYLEQVPLKKFMIIDICIIWSWYIFAGLNWNPYITLLTFSCIIWYRQSRRGVISKHLLKTLVHKKYKATLLSIFWLTLNLIWWSVAYGMGVMMNHSYSVWFMITWGVLICFGWCYLLILRKYLNF